MPKSYCIRACLLMKHLLDKAMPARINWNDDGIVTIDGNVMKDSNIADLINDRKRKIMEAAGKVRLTILCLKCPLYKKGK